jgi:peptidoglycan/xylan/chitin deacetylase (PgdA/CDA1 family)
MRIPITMCHGIRPTVTGGELRYPLPAEHFDSLMSIAAEMGFQSINYDQLAAWRDGAGSLPDHPIMIDFDHPVTSMRGQVFETLERYGFKGNLFIYTSPYDPEYDRPLALAQTPEHMTWEDLRELVQANWHIGAHTISHPNLSMLSEEDPDGKILRVELDRCNQVIERNLGFTPKDFAFTGTSWSSMAEQEVKRRYRFGRLWIVGSQYQVDGKPMRYAELAGSSEADEEDGGPPNSTRYITENTDPHRLPSMELQGLVNQSEAFRSYLQGALDG